MFFAELRRRWRALWNKEQLDQELDQELQFHLERDIDQNLQQGMSPKDARAAALRAFGGIEQAKEQCRDARGTSMIENLIYDLRYSFRLLVKNPAFTIVAVLTLALVIGANTAIFSFVNGILLRPLPFPESERLVVLDETALKRGVNSMSTSFPNVLDWREQNHVFEDIGMFGGSGNFSAAGSGEPENVRGTRISHGMFEILRVSPILGRTFTAAEDQPGQNDVIILGYDLWQRHYGGDRTIIGKRIAISNHSPTVIGVMPSGFKFPQTSELWIPLALTTQTFTRTDHGLGSIARLKDGIDVAQAQAEMNTIALRIEEQNPVTNEGLGVSVTSLRKVLTGDYREALLILLGVVGCVLLVACVNVANLMLARGSARQKEFALRAALGASRARILQQILIETLLLSAVGGVLGLALSVWALRLLLKAIPIQLPFWMNFSLDFRVLGFTAAVTFLTGLIFGVAPALFASRVDLNDDLKEGGRGSAIGSRGRSRSALVVVEVALSLILLVGAGLMVKSFRHLRNVNVGADPKGVLTMAVILPEAKYEKGEQRGAFIQQLLEKVRALPGIDAAGATATLPLNGDHWGRSLTVEGFPVLPVGQAPMIQHTVVTPGYFRAMGIPLLAGREFNDADREGAPKVTIIDERLAKEYWPNTSPLGKRVRFGPPEDNEPWHEVIGVVGAVRHERMDAETRKSVYLPHLQIPVNGLSLVTRSANPLGAVGSVRAEIRQLDRELVVSDVATMEDVMASSIWQPRLYALLFAVFAGGALLLAVIGIYGVMAYNVITRTHEIGVRMALGATGGNVLTLIVGQGMKLTIIGVLIGLAGAFALTRLMRQLLFETSTTDPATFALIALLLASAALLACYIPARRATKVNPLEVLRYE